MSPYTRETPDSCTDRMSEDIRVTVRDTDRDLRILSSSNLDSTVVSILRGNKIYGDSVCRD